MTTHDLWADFERTEGTALERAAMRLRNALDALVTIDRDDTPEARARRQAARIELVLAQSAVLDADDAL